MLSSVSQHSEIFTLGSVSTRLSSWGKGKADSEIRSCWLAIKFFLSVHWLLSAVHVGTSSTAESRLRNIKDYRALGVEVREFGARVIFSSVLPKRKGLKRPVKSVESKNSYRPGATARDFSTYTTLLTLKNVVNWEVMGSICQRRRGTSLFIGVPRWWRRL